ncbi:hypothetical protein ACF8R4_07985 [Pseudomonas sp. FYR_2]|uniref:hypothetical protein n=1 Tax=unclassified Pseudomonas TaxID=196821 RepID=UPI00370B5EE2
MIGANDPVRKATGGLFDLDEIIAVAFLFCLLVFVTGAGVDPEPQTKCAPVINPQAGNERQLSPHETQPEPTPALAPGRWIDERYQL